MRATVFALALVVSAATYADKAVCHLVPGAYWAQDEATIDLARQVFADGDSAAYQLMKESFAIIGPAKGDSRIYVVRHNGRINGRFDGTFRFRFPGQVTVNWALRHEVSCTRATGN